MKLPVLIAMTLLTGCSSIPFKIVSDTTALKSAKLTWNAPPMIPLSQFKWDFPRLSNKVVVKNSSKCLKLGERGVLYSLGKLPENCSIPAIDINSNLFIGLTQQNYRNLVSDWKILLSREPQWRALLNRINK